MEINSDYWLSIDQMYKWENKPMGWVETHVAGIQPSKTINDKWYWDFASAASSYTCIYFEYFGKLLNDLQDHTVSIIQTHIFNKKLMVTLESGCKHGK